MAFPTGSGSERLKSTQVMSQSATPLTYITGVALHIYTVISVIVSNQSTATDKTFDLYLTDSDGTSNVCRQVTSQGMGAYGTFVFNDRFSFEGDRKLRIITNASGNFDVTCTYIDQDWT
jgi:hypothetical protein